MKYFQILFLFLIMSCQHHERDQVTDLNIGFFNEELNWVSDEPVLKIYFESTECGEWGGHEEHITISKKNKKNYKLDYEKYQVNCDSMFEVFDGIGYLIKPLSTLIEKNEIEVNEEDKKAILDFSIDMVKSKFNEEALISHSGIKLSICNSDSTFYIWKYGGNANDYYKLLNRLKLN